MGILPCSGRIRRAASRLGSTAMADPLVIKTAFLFSLSTLCLGAGETKLQRFFMATIRKTDLVPGSIDAIVKIFAWSFNCLVAGMSASVDHAGCPIKSKPRKLAGGWKGILMSVRGAGICMSRPSASRVGRGPTTCAGCVQHRMLSLASCTPISRRARGGAKPGEHMPPGWLVCALLAIRPPLRCDRLAT